MPPLPTSQPKWVSKILVAFLSIVGLLLFTNLGRDPLLDWDEGIYAELGSELLVSGSIFKNTWNYSPWFEKPPGISWLSAAGQLLAGHTPLGARLLQPLVTSLTLYVVYLVGTKLNTWRTGLIAMGLLAGYDLFLGQARIVNTDMPLLFGSATTVYLLLANKRPFQVAFAVALSVWFKGPAGFLALLIGLPLLFTKGKRFVHETIYLILAIILPWHLYLYFCYGRTFYTHYLLEHVVKRIIVPIEFHNESSWFYFDYLCQNLGIGMIFGLALGLLSLSTRLIKTRDPKFFALLWWLFCPLVIFTFAKTKLFWYVLPVYPAIALILAYFLDSLATRKLSRHVVTIIAFGILSQAVLTVSSSVELRKRTAPLPDHLRIASALSGSGAPLAVLVSPEERQAKANLPQAQRISGTFRYGGMPSVVYYYQGPVKFFYNPDEFTDYWENNGGLAMLSVLDQSLIVGKTLATTPTYLGLGKQTLYSEH